MLSYQHAYHAGGRADVLKHAALHAILVDINAHRKPLQTVCYVETHSGRGVYDVTSELFSKTGEAKDGILALLELENAPYSLQPWLTNYGTPQAYFGSPSLARNVFTEPQDRFVFIEKHLTEHKELNANLAQNSTRIIKGDGYAEALRLTPRRSEQFVVFVDPAYETEADLENMAAWVPRALKKWPKAIIIVWLPRFLDEREVEFGQWLAGLEQGAIAGAEWGHPPDGKDTALTGSAIVAYRIRKEVGRTITKIASDLNELWGRGD